MGIRRLATNLLKLAVGALSIAEVVHWSAHRSDYGKAEKTAGKKQLIVVLGCPANFDGSPHKMQVWRTKIAVRTIDPQAEQTTLVFTGADTRSVRSEAEVMADLAKQYGVDPGQIVLEERSNSTWTNIEYTTKYMEQADVVQLVSTPIHAHRARWYLLRQRPDLTHKLAPTNDYRFGEHPIMKISSVFYETVGAYREWRRPRLPDAISRID